MLKEEEESDEEEVENTEVVIVSGEELCRDSRGRNDGL